MKIPPQFTIPTAKLTYPSPIKLALSLSYACSVTPYFVLFTRPRSAEKETNTRKCSAEKETTERQNRQRYRTGTRKALDKWTNI